MQSATISGGTKDGQKSTFDYDAAGNTKTRTVGATTQNLTWDDEGHLAALTENGKTTSYQYDADGERLIAKDADGTQTLTLPGDNELKIAGDGTKSDVRYYTHGDDTVAVRTSKGFSYLISDHQGTAMTAVAMTTLAVTRRRQLPFGALRSEDSESLPGTRGFVGGTEDPTGLTHLGAREYDPTTGRFLSVDPILDINDPLQMNAYAYANSRPITASDPDGRQYLDPFTGLGFGNTTAQEHAYTKWGYTDKHGKTTKKYRTKLAYDNKQSQRFYNSSYYKKQVKVDSKAADRERIKKEGIFGSIMKGKWGDAWSATKGSTAGHWVGDHWEDIKTYSAVVGFGVCVAASAGVCIGVGAGIATAKFVGDGVGYGSWDVSAYSKDLAWTAVGGGSAATFGRLAGGAKTWSAAYRSNAIARVPRAYRTKVPGLRGVGGGFKSWVTTPNPKGAIDWGSTYGNLGVNAAFNTGFCGSGAASLGSYGGAC